MMRVTTVLLLAAVVLRAAGYGTLTVIAYCQEAAVCASYCLILASEALSAGVGIWLWVRVEKRLCWWNAAPRLGRILWR